MKTPLLLFLFLWIVPGFGQSITITDVDVAPLNQGLNVNLKTISFNGANFLGSTYQIDGNTITLDVCFSFNMTLPVLSFENDFYIPLEAGEDYTLNLTVYNSSDLNSCDHYSVGGTYTTEFLSVTRPEKGNGKFTVSPNPSSGMINLNSKSILNISIYDVSGRLVKMKDNPGMEMNLQDLPDGVYLVKAQSEKGIATSKVILAK